MLLLAQHLSCQRIPNGQESKTATSGSHSQFITNLTATTTTNVVFSLVCTGAGGSVTKTVTVTVTPKAPAQPTLSSPSSGSTVNSLTPTLTWKAVSGAGAYIWNVLNTRSFTTSTPGYHILRETLFGAILHLESKGLY